MFPLTVGRGWAVREGASTPGEGGYWGECIDALAPQKSLTEFSGISAHREGESVDDSTASLRPCRRA